MATQGTHADLVARLREEAAARMEGRPSRFDYASSLLAEAADALAALPPPADPPITRGDAQAVVLGVMRQRSTVARALDGLAKNTDLWGDFLLELGNGIAAVLTSRPADPPALVALGERLRTQDNQMTAHPIFVVEHRNDARRPWEFVTACLTDEGARAYMNANGHNLRKFSRIFVHSGYRNDEWIGLRNHLMALPAAPPVTDRE